MCELIVQDCVSQKQLRSQLLLNTIGNDGTSDYNVSCFWETHPTVLVQRLNRFTNKIRFERMIHSETSLYISLQKE